MLRLIIAAPFLLFIVLFAVSNQHPVRLGLWPTEFSIEVPVSLAVLVAMAVAFLFGALMLWVSTLGARGRARRAEYSRSLLENQVKVLEARANAQPASPRSSAAPGGTALATRA
jgi:uncharacterized integral membrane protein